MSEERTQVMPAASAIRPARPGELLGDVVYEQLSDMIVRGVFPVGSPLREARLATDLGTSRVPVREAIQRLVEEGWVTRRSRAGVRVVVPTRKMVDDVFGLRRLLEGEAARLAVENTTMRQIRELRSFIQAGQAAVGVGDVSGIVDANMAFHNAIAEAAGNDLLAHVLRDVSRKVQWLHSSVAAERAGTSLQEHVLIVDALEARDADAAEKSARDHVDGTHQRLQQQYPE